MIAIRLERTSYGFRVTTDEKGRPVFLNLLDVKPYVSIFQNSHNIYHPDEASADLFARLVISEGYSSNNNPRKSDLDRAVGPLSKWFEKNFR